MTSLAHDVKALKKPCFLLTPSGGLLRESSCEVPRVADTEQQEPKHNRADDHHNFSLRQRDRDRRTCQREIDDCRQESIEAFVRPNGNRVNPSPAT